MSASSEPWVVLYDGNCGFCTWMLGGLLRWDRDRRLAPRAIQSDAGQALLADLSPQERLASWHLVAPGGERWSAGAAAPRLLRLLPGGGPLALLAGAVPPLTDRSYRWVAEHRAGLSRLVPSGAKRRAAGAVRAREA